MEGLLLKALRDKDADLLNRFAQAAAATTITGGNNRCNLLMTIFKKCIVTRSNLTWLYDILSSYNDADKYMRALFMLFLAFIDTGDFDIDLIFFGPVKIYYEIKPDIYLCYFCPFDETTPAMLSYEKNIFMIYDPRHKQYYKYMSGELRVRLYYYIMINNYCGPAAALIKRVKASRRGFYIYRRQAWEQIKIDLLENERTSSYLLHL